MAIYDIDLTNALNTSDEDIICKGGGGYTPPPPPPEPTPPPPPPPKKSEAPKIDTPETEERATADVDTKRRRAPRVRRKSPTALNDSGTSSPTILGS